MQFLVSSVLKKKKKISNKISHMDSKFRRRYGSIDNTPRNQRKMIKKQKKRLRKLQKRLKKRKYKNIIQSTENIERLINNSKVGLLNYVRQFWGGRFEKILRNLTFGGEGV